MMVGSSLAASVALVAGIVGVIVGVAGIVSVVIVLGKQGALEKTVNLFAVANSELRAQVDSGRDERHGIRLEFEQRLADERADCARVTGDLQGQLKVLTGNLGKDIATAVLQAFKEGQASIPPPPADMTTATVTHTTVTSP